MRKYKTGNAIHVPTQSDLKAMFTYDDDLGCLRWKIKTAQKVNIGDRAGTVRKDGYTQIRINSVRYLAHRLIYTFFYGHFDSELKVDHIDGDPRNNRIENLQTVTNRENLQKQKKQSNNTSGLAGVSYMSGPTHHKSPWIGQYSDESGKRVGKWFSNKYASYHFHCENSARVKGEFYIEHKLSTEDRHAYIDWLIEETDKNNQHIFKLAA